MTTETDYMQTYADRWQSIVENPDGTLNLDAVARELADYDMLTDRVTEVYLAVTAERIGGPGARAQAVIDIVNERIDAAEASVNRWWIADGELAKGAHRLLGPFATRDLALEVRSYMEKATAPNTYWVDSESESE